MNTINKRLLPLRSYSENDVVNEFSLDRTGDFGMLVKVSVGDLDAIHGEVADSFGGSFDGVISPQWGTKNKITPSTSGDTKYDVLGLTLYSTLSEDENGENLKFYRQKGIELASVISGDAVPVIGKGRFDLGPEGYTVTGGAPSLTAGVQASIGDRLVPSNTQVGIIDIVPAAKIVASPVLLDEYGEDQVIGKVIGTGTQFGGSVRAILNV